MSFDASVYFAAVPDDFASKWQGALREVGIDMTVQIPPDWKEEGYWYLLDKPTDKREDGDAFAVGRVDRAHLEENEYKPDEMAMLSKARYSARVSTRLSAGTAALAIAGSLAKVTNGILVEYQGAAFQRAFEPDLATLRGPRGPEGKPTLAERGFYDTPLAWGIAKASHAYDERQKSPSEDPPPAAPNKSRRGWLYFGLGLIALGGISKLVQRNKDEKKK